MNDSHRSLLLTFLSMFVGCETAQTLSPEEFPAVAPDETLQVLIRVAEDPEDLDAYVYLKESLEQAFAESGIQNPVEISRWPGGSGSDVPVLEVELVAWRPTSAGLQIEAILGGTFHNDGKRVSLGSFRAGGAMPPVVTDRSDRLIRGYKQVAGEALREMLTALQPYL